VLPLYYEMYIRAVLGVCRRPSQPIATTAHPQPHQLWVHTETWLPKSPPIMRSSSLVSLKTWRYFGIPFEDVYDALCSLTPT
jgi:hypothetical protein